MAFLYNWRMSDYRFPAGLGGLRIHLVGAKGTGMAALAEILASRGARLTGSDVADEFYTDVILRAIGLDLRVGFEAGNLPEATDLVIHSAAYARDRNPELVEADRRGLTILSYPEALGALSASFDASGIAGVHGKTTTTAMAGSLIAALGLPATVLAGSAVPSFGGRSTKILGDAYLVAETCEYRRHFLNFHPRRVVLTSVESDHQDYYPTYEDILAAFVEYGLRLPRAGELIYCADDQGACAAADRIRAGRPDLTLTPYGARAPGPYRMEYYRADEGLARFKLAGFEREFELRVPGEHLALDAAAALALSVSLLCDHRARVGEGAAKPLVSPAELETLAAALSAFAGSKRRSERVGEAGGVLFMDDYGHHPTAIRDTIRGMKAFWPRRRLVVDFMSHTYSRTKALFGEFVESLDEADVVVLHKIYASAREAPDPSIRGEMLFDAVRRRRTEKGGDPSTCIYSEEPLAAAGALADLLRPGDLFLTMGAGDNWKLGERLLEMKSTKD
jgi:UDP-N-acetylmuramate--alanine ligase